MIYLILQQNSPRHEKQVKPVERIDDEEKRLLKLMGWTDGGTESTVSFSPLFSSPSTQWEFSFSSVLPPKYLASVIHNKHADAMFPNFVPGLFVPLDQQLRNARPWKVRNYRTFG